MTDEQLAALLSQPALDAPEGVTPDFDNPPNENGLAWFVTTFCMVIATICLCLRAYARLWLTRKVQIEEGNAETRSSCVLSMEGLTK